MTTCNHALYSIVDVFTQYYSELGEMLLQAIYTQFTSCIQQRKFRLKGLYHTYFLSIGSTQLECIYRQLI